MGTENDESTTDGAIAFTFLVIWIVTSIFLLSDHWQWFLAHPVFFLFPGLILAPFLGQWLWRLAVSLYSRTLNFIFPSRL